MKTKGQKTNNVTHTEIIEYIENNPVGSNGYKKDGTPTGETYQDAKQEIEGNNKRRIK